MGPGCTLPCFPTSSAHSSSTQKSTRTRSTVPIHGRLICARWRPAREQVDAGCSPAHVNAEMQVVMAVVSSSISSIVIIVVVVVGVAQEMRCTGWVRRRSSFRATPLSNALHLPRWAGCSRNSSSKQHRTSLINCIHHCQTTSPALAESWPHKHVGPFPRYGGDILRVAHASSSTTRLVLQS